MDKKILNKENIVTDKKTIEKNNKHRDIKKNTEQNYKKYKEDKYFQLLWLVP